MKNQIVIQRVGLLRMLVRIPLAMLTLLRVLLCDVLLWLLKDRNIIASFEKHIADTGDDIFGSNSKISSQDQSSSSDYDFSYQWKASEPDL